MIMASFFRSDKLFFFTEPLQVNEHSILKLVPKMCKFP